MVGCCGSKRAPRDVLEPTMVDAKIVSNDAQQAIKIQSAMRGRLARTATSSSMEEKRLQSVQSAAAVTIQVRAPIHAALWGICLCS